MLLSQAIAGKTYQITAIDLPTQQIQLLSSRGITALSDIRLLMRRRTGTVMLLCRRSRFALGSYYASHILVRTCPAERM